MSSIPPNINSILQSQVSAAETARSSDAQRNKRVRDSKQLAQMADQQQHEVEHAYDTENLQVHPENQRERDGQDARDLYEEHAQAEQSKPAATDGKKPASVENADSAEGHIDLNA